MPIGLYGKLPSHGDFLQRAVGDAFVNDWDAWLQAGLSSSRRALGDGWLDVYLTSPVWRFALAGGVLGVPAWAGVLMPSVDRVGRYFPLTLVAELPPAARPCEVAVIARGWYDWSEALGREALEHDVLDLDQFEGQLDDSAALLRLEHLREGALELPGAAETGQPLWRLPLGADADMGQFFARLAAELLGQQLGPLALWWTTGSEHLSPTALMTRGLPPAARFTEWLGAFGDAGPIDRLLAIPPVRYRSAAVSDVGRWREENQDAFLERSAEGLWLVADGMGGHRDGALASALIVQHAQRAPLSGDLTAMVQAIAEALHSAHAELAQRAAAEPGFDAGSTVVALCLRAGEGAALWVGDSRLYRWRGGELLQLTQDHSVAAESALGSRDPDGYIITRAVGGPNELQIDETRFDAQPGDRFLLCTDGLYADLTSAEISESLGALDTAAGVSRLLALALERGGKDNATGVLVAVLPPGEDEPDLRDERDAVTAQAGSEHR